MHGSAYQDHPVAFLTQHGKQDLVRTDLEAALGCHLLHTQAYDTDQLGTFTRDVVRPSTQIAAAREKATIGMALTGARVGLASEGAFSPDPFAGIMLWNTELLLWVDADRGLEVAAWASGPAQSAHQTLESIDELRRFAALAQFPSHHVVLRPEHADHTQLHKGLSDMPSLLAAFEQAKAASGNGRVFAENDLRAFCNPTRQAMIRRALHDLIHKLSSACPSCAAPGYTVMQKKPGLPCQDCGEPTRMPVAEVWRCQACGAEEQRLVSSGLLADPSRCDACNP